MTINEYKQGLPSEVYDLLCDTLDFWSNEACAGYVAAACNRCGIGVEQKNALLRALWLEFDWMSVDEASSFFQTSDVAK